MEHSRVTYAFNLCLAGKPVVDFLSYGRDVISGNLSKSAFFEGGESLGAQTSDGRGRHPPTTVGVRKLE